MENIEKFGQVYFNGETIKLDSASIETLENKIQEMENKEKNIKNQIFNILESL